MLMMFMGMVMGIPTSINRVTHRKPVSPMLMVMVVTVMSFPSTSRMLLKRPPGLSTWGRCCRREESWAIQVLFSLLKWGPGSLQSDQLKAPPIRLTFLLTWSGSPTNMKVDCGTSLPKTSQCLSISRKDCINCCQNAGRLVHEDAASKLHVTASATGNFFTSTQLHQLHWSYCTDYDRLLRLYLGIFKVFFVPIVGVCGTAANNAL